MFVSKLTRKRSKAVGCGKQQDGYKKIKIYILQKLTYLSAKRDFFCPFFLTSRHGPYRQRILQTQTTETTHRFFPATRWKWHSIKLHNYLLCLSSLRRSRDVTTDIYILNILNSICLIHLSILYAYLIHLFIYFYSFIYFLFSAVRRPPSAVRHPPSAMRSPFPYFTDTRFPGRTVKGRGDRHDCEFFQPGCKISDIDQLIFPLIFGFGVILV